MMHNTQRLPLVLEIGLIAAQARIHSELDKLLPIKVTIDPHDDPRFLLASDLWFNALDMVIRLAEIDHRHNFTPKTSPMLTEFGLLNEYWNARDRIDPVPDDLDD